MTNDTKLISDYLKNEPIIIGLTGKTGSGCTTVADIIKNLEVNRNLPELNIQSPGTDQEQRKSQIVYDYFRSECSLKVHVIRAVDAIDRFIDEKAFDSIVNHIKNKNPFKNKGENEWTNNKLDNLKKIDNLEEKKKELKKIIKNHTINFRTTSKGDPRKQANLYTYIYQVLGNTIRKTGRAKLSYPGSKKQEVDLTYLMSLAKNMDGYRPIGEDNTVGDKYPVDELGDKYTVDKAIKETGSQETTVIVIDSIRNPFEAAYFKKRYANFYLIAVNRLDNERINELKKKGMKTEEIEDLDKQEYPGEDVDQDNCYKVHIRKCEEIADIFIVNDSEIGRSTLRQQVVRYLTLMMKPGIINPTPVEAAMQVANTVKLNSECLSRQVGAVITE